LYLRPGPRTASTVCAEKQIVAGPKTSRNPDGSIVRGGCLGLINCSAPLRGREHPATRLLDDAVVRDGWPIKARIYVCETGESMKVVDLAAAQEGRWRNTHITHSPAGSAFGRFGTPPARRLPILPAPAGAQLGTSPPPSTYLPSKHRTDGANVDRRLRVQEVWRVIYGCQIQLHH
jgi:hypothetical protein